MGGPCAGSSPSWTAQMTWRPASSRRAPSGYGTAQRQRQAGVRQPGGTTIRNGKEPVTSAPNVLEEWGSRVGPRASPHSGPSTLGMPILPDRPRIVLPGGRRGAVERCCHPWQPSARWVVKTWLPARLWFPSHRRRTSITVARESSTSQHMPSLKQKTARRTLQRRQTHLLAELKPKAVSKRPWSIPGAKHRPAAHKVVSH